MFFFTLKIPGAIFYTRLCVFSLSLLIPSVTVAESVHTTINGKVLFEKLCASCHGAEGKPPESMRLLLNPYPADLSLDVYRYGKNFDDIYYSISSGRGVNMLPFGNRLSAAQIKALTEFVLSLSQDVNKVGKDLTSKPELQEVDEQSQEEAQGLTQ